MCKGITFTTFARIGHVMGFTFLIGLCLALSVTSSLGQSESKAKTAKGGSATSGKQGIAIIASDNAKVDVQQTINQIQQRDPYVAKALENEAKALNVALNAQKGMQATEERAAKTQQENEMLKAKLESLQAQGFLRIVDDAQAPNADHASKNALDALSRGDMEGAERYLQTEEKRLATIGKQHMKKAAELARERAALAFSRNIEMAVAALSSAADYEPDNADNWWLLGDVQKVQGNLTDALNAYRQMQKILKAEISRNPANSDWQLLLSVSYIGIGDVQKAQGDLKAAMMNYQDSRTIFVSLVKKYPANSDWQRGLSWSYQSIGDVQKAQGDLKAAMMNYQDALAISAALVKKDPTDVRCDLDVIVSYFKIASLAPQVMDSKTGFDYLRQGRGKLAKLQDSGRLPPNFEHWIAAFDKKIEELKQ